MIPFEKYSPAELRRLTGGKTVSPILPYSALPAVIQSFTENSGRISLSGAQSKYSVRIRDGRFCLTAPGEQGTHILKPRLTHFLNAEYSPENEHLTMQIARRVFHIETAENALCFFGNGEAAYITRRYDIAPGGGKIAQEDFASLGGISAERHGRDFKYSALSYEDIAALIRKYLPLWRVALVQFFDLLLFNFLFSNGDAHLKNFSVLMTPDGDYRLAPAYDLINTHLHLPDDDIFALRRGLFRDGRKFSLGIGGKDFVEFAVCIGIPEAIAQKELTRFCTESPEIKIMIEESFLPEDLKQSYYEMYRTRLYSFLRG